MVSKDHPSWFHSTRGRTLLGGLAAVLAFALYSTTFLQSMEYRLFDFRIRRLAPQQAPNPDLVLVAIDEDSLRRMEPAVGRWPWPRAVLASIIDHCSEAKVFVMDVLLPEGDWHYRQSDDVLVQAVRDNPQVINAIHLNDLPLDRTALESLDRFDLGPDFALFQPRRVFTSALAPFDELLKASRRVGHVNTYEDSDGVTRTHAPIQRLGERVLPSIALAAAQQAQDLDPNQTTLAEAAVLQVGPHRFPLDDYGRMTLLPSGWNYTTYPAASVLQSWQAESRGERPTISRERFRDKIVIFGSAAKGLQEDATPTSLAPRTTGMQLLAGSIDNLLSGACVRHVAPVWVFLLGAILALAPALRPMLRPWTMAMDALLYSIAFVLIAEVLFQRHHLALPLAAPLAALWGSCTLIGITTWAFDLRERRRLENADLAKQRMTDMLVHDLRNALVPIVSGVSYLQLLEQEEHHEDSDQEDMLRTIEDSTDRLLCRINAMLDISRMRDGRMPIKPNPVSAGDLLDRVTEEFSLPAERAGKALNHTTTLARPVQIRVDRDVFDRVMQNLVWNAIKHGEPDTDITLTAERDGSLLMISVANHCKPLSPEQQKALFEAFVSGPTTAPGGKLPSMGLGLAFCKLAVESHHGIIRLTSPCPGEQDGVRVTITLPVFESGQPGETMVR